MMYLHRTTQLDPDMIENEIQQIEKIYALITEYLVTYSFQLVAALLILLFGLWVAKKLSSLVFKLLEKNNVDITLNNFITNVIKVLLIIMFVIIALGKIGISITPFIAAIGAASLGAGLALQGMLSNYGAGLAIIATRPFIVGDTILVNGIFGQVKSIELGVTILTNEDDIVITVPNKHIVGEIIHNSFALSLIEGEIGIAYHADPEFAISLIEQALNAQPEFVASAKIQVGINQFADSSVVIGYRYWVKTNQIIKAKMAINLTVFNTLKNNNIEIPFPQRVVTIKQA